MQGSSDTTQEKIYERSHMSGNMQAHIRLLRVPQYIKNVFIFLPLFFAFQITDPVLFARAAAAFVSFSLLASSVYIFNDIRDIEDDQRHPVKKNRPLASGKVEKNAALVFMVCLLVSGCAIAAMLDARLLYPMGFYLVLNWWYAVRLKHIPIVDIFIIAFGFVLRILVGAIATASYTSMWIITMTFLLALFLGLAKRRDDVLIYLRSEEKVRKSIDGYNLAFIDSAMVCMSAVIIVSYIMYTVSPDVIARMKTENLFFTTAFVVMGIMRYMQVTLVEEGSGSPTDIVLKDRFIQLSILGWLAALAVLMYL